MHEVHPMVAFAFTIFAFLSLSSAVVSNLPLQLISTTNGDHNITIANDNHNSFPLPLSPPANYSISNVSTPSSFLAPGTTYICSEAFGSDLNYTSCESAVGVIGVSKTVISFAERDAGVQADILLPQRFVSSDGECVIEPVIESGATIARASPENIALAGFVIARNCVAKEPSKGGIAKNIGGNNKLRVAVEKYNTQNVRCYGRMLAPDVQTSCQELLNTMPVENKEKFFGPRSDPLVDVALPYLLLSKDEKCKMTIRTTGPGDGGSDQWSWARFWEVGVTLAGKCVRAGKEGVQTRLGVHELLYMEVGPPQASDSLLGSDGDVTES